MTQIQDLWWPDDVGTKWQHALMHVKSIDWAIARCQQRRTAIQAGGNIGLWPRRLAESFQTVITFEPDHDSFQCLCRNLNGVRGVHAWETALGATLTTCAVLHKSLGSHRVTDGTDVDVTTIDAQGRLDVDLIQLDVEGYEWHALQGASATIARCKPLIQVELRDNLLQKYGKSAKDIRAWLGANGYQQVSSQQGSDFVFEAR